MRTVIKEAPTIADYKALKAAMEQDAIAAYERHKAACDSWEHGDINKIWIDTDGVLCIEYQDGQWWHYASGEWW